MEVQADEHDTDFWVQDGGVAGGDALVVVWFDVAEEVGVRAADGGEVFGGEFLFDACFADDEDFALVGGEI